MTARPSAPPARGRRDTAPAATAALGSDPDRTPHPGPARTPPGAASSRASRFLPPQPPCPTALKRSWGARRGLTRTHSPSTLFSPHPLLSPAKSLMSDTRHPSEIPARNRGRTGTERERNGKGGDFRLSCGSCTRLPEPPAGGNRVHPVGGTGSRGLLLRAPSLHEHG